MPAFSFDSIDPAGDPTDLGKVDSVAITNPFTSNSPIVTDVKINSAQALLQNSTNPPTQPGYATWYYNTSNNTIVVQTSPFDVKDSLVVTFVQNMPTSATNGTYTGVFD